eukprot:TRINITY_DN5927_c0_g1_i2.p1 TRINITY_DN5927_c0_g1~~TRINITY_DN5927_c0_g1_i2.p1  ORF type:complete len:217 (-),score=13.59 TRINITY_DN5927_c0_g1_i2:151-801(-)
MYGQGDQNNFVDEEKFGRNGFAAKIVVLGDMGVGKTTLVNQYVNGTMSSKYTPTIGASFLTKRIVIDEVRMKLQIWDTAGQERFRTLAPMYYRGASAALLVYDITEYNTFVKIQDWVRELQMNVTTPLVMAVVANKADAMPDCRIPPDEARRYATSIGAFFFETSAVSRQGIEELFTTVAREVNRTLNVNSMTVTEPSVPSPLHHETPSCCQHCAC